jgi:hypothetical protein
MGFHSKGTIWGSWNGATSNKINFHVRNVILYDVINFCLHGQRFDLSIQRYLETRPFVAMHLLV